MKRYQLCFRFFETEQAAKNFCYSENKSGSYYKRKTYPAHFTPWESPSPTDKAHFIAWYHM